MISPPTGGISIAEDTTVPRPQRPPLLTRQTWTALASAATFVALALALALIPVPYVVYAPGHAYDVLGNGSDNKPVVTIENAQTYATPGSLSMTTVQISRSDTSPSLPEALLAHLLPNRDALPRESIYKKSDTNESVQQDEKRRMDTSQQDAVVAALRASGQKVEEWPVVAQVTVSGPANNKLRPGDLVLAVDGAPTRTPQDVQRGVAARSAGDIITFTVWRDRREQRVAVTSTGRYSDAKTATVGIELATGYRYPQVVHFGIDPAVGGPSAGLVFALAVYDKLTPEPLVAGRKVAGTGTINARGEVGPIGGIHEKIAGAERAGATVFLVPAANCRDLQGLSTHLDLIRADTLQSSITALRKNANPATANEVPRCS